jgi:hypothetical protein
VSGKAERIEKEERERMMMGEKENGDEEEKESEMDRAEKMLLSSLPEMQWDVGGAGSWLLLD